ncbi:MAG: mechanosensitive ion channel family protein [Oscillospiraceae bacterium]|nr:mechanosensitive ion channel family protein [Oscillospiraceae bacterium]
MTEKITEIAEKVGDFTLYTLLPAMLMLVAGLLVIRIVKSILKKILANSKLEKAAHSLILSLTSVVLYILLGLMVASSLGIDVSGIVALASVLTLAVSLSVQNFLTNVIGGFTLLYTQPFHSGDFVEIGMEAGTVVEIGMTYTKLQTPDNKMISIPNATVVAGDIVNYAVTGTRRVDVNVQAAYTENSDQVLSALLEAGRVDRILPDPAPSAVILGYTETAVQYSVRVWVKTEDYWDVMFAINRNVKRIFDQQEIRAAFPHVHVYMEQ